MRAIQPYITVIADSFHEALASRVLYILIAVVTLILAAIAPFGFREERGQEFHINQIRDWQGLVTRIDEQARSNAPSPGAQIWKYAGNDFKDAIEDAARRVVEGDDGEAGAAEPRPRRRRMVVDVGKAMAIVAGLNDVLDEPQLYDAKAWPEKRLDPAAKKYLERGLEKISADDLKQFNRLLIISAYRSRLESLASEELYLEYGPWKLGNPWNSSLEDSKTIVTMVLGQVMAILVGAIGVFIAIVVTSPIIPRTFEAGAVDLLMSKPVSRPLLFLAKFFGGCAFIFFLAGYFVVGLWLIIGLRFDVWSGKLLLCIPIFMFLFSIYYCVSAAAGVLWKNPIVAVVMSIIFWALCFGVGAMKAIIEDGFLNSTRIVKIAPCGDSLIAVNQAGAFLEWDAKENDWTPIFSSIPRPAPGEFIPLPPLVIGPVFDESKQELIFLEQYRGGGQLAMLGARTTFVRATESPTWSRHPEIEAPAGASWLLIGPTHEPIVVTADGIYRLIAKDGEDSPSFLGVKIPWFGGAAAEPFESIGPELSLSGYFSAAIDPDTGDLAIYDDGSLTLFSRKADEDAKDPKGAKYVQVKSRAIVAKAAANDSAADDDVDANRKTEQAAIALVKDAVAIAFADGRIQVVDRTDLTTIGEEAPRRNREPYAALAAPGGAFLAVLFHDGNLWLYDVAAKRGVVHGGDISAATFDLQGRLWLAEHWTRVDRYDPATMKVEEEHHPEAGILQTVDRLGVRPLYTIFPKPGELDNVVNYVLTDQESMTNRGPSAMADLRESRVKIDIYTPIWSSLAFVVVMLGLTCWYVSRTDL